MQVRFIERSARAARVKGRTRGERANERVREPMENSHLNCRTWRGDRSRLIDSSKPSADYAGKADAMGEKFFFHVVRARHRRGKKKQL